MEVTDCHRKHCQALHLLCPGIEEGYQNKNGAKRLAMQLGHFCNRIGVRLPRACVIVRQGCWLPWHRRIDVGIVKSDIVVDNDYPDTSGINC